MGCRYKLTPALPRTQNNNRQKAQINPAEASTFFASIIGSAKTFSGLYNAQVFGLITMSTAAGNATTAAVGAQALALIADNASKTTLESAASIFYY